MVAMVRTHRRGGGPSLDDYLRSWIQTCPGYFRADTEAAVLERALSFFLPHYHDIDLSLGDFAAALARAGYRPSERKNHGTGRTYWVLGLPERR